MKNAISSSRIRASAVWLSLLCVWFAHPAMAIEEPRYQVVLQDGDFEVRQYPSMLVAETEVEGDMDQASNAGFRRIADFIFGNNQAPGTDQSAKIAMTAPVTVEPLSAKIAMTAPVTIEPQSPDTQVQQAQKWRVHFVMPSAYTLATLPKPNNSAVRIREIPGQHMVVLRYSGFNTMARVQSKTDETLQWLQQHSLKALGTPQLSRYDPPWTLPMFRRNEIMVEVETPAAAHMK